MSFTDLFDAPFYTGTGGLSEQVPWPWPVAIGGHVFAVDLAHYSWDIPDMMRQSFDSSDRPGEGTFETKGVWRRVYQDWSLGAGQIYADPATTDKQATRQFTSSLGVDCWTPRQFSMLPQTDVFVPAAISPTFTFALGRYLYAVLGSLILRWSDPFNDPAGTGEAIVPSVADIADITNDGNTVYFATLSGIWTHDSTAAPGATVALMAGAAGTAAGAADVIEWANGFLFIGKGAALSTVAANGTITAIHTQPVTRWTWTAIVGAPNAVYAGGASADRSCIYSIAIDPNTGGLAVPIYAGELARGEVLTALSYYGSVMMIGTTKGWHLAEIGSGNSLNIGPLVPTPAPVTAFCADANFIWYAWSNYDATHTGVGRANLAELTDPLLPAYASDLMADGQGTVTSIARFDDHTWFSVDDVGIYRETASGARTPTATIRLGRLEWGTTAPKTFLGAEIVTEPLHGTFAVTLEDETLTDTAIGGRTVSGTTGRSVHLGAGLGTNSNFYDLIVDLARDATDPTVGPVVRTVTGRALAMPQSARDWTLAIIATEKVQPQPDELEVTQDVDEITDFLVELRDSGRPVIFQHGFDRHLVVVRSVSLPDGAAGQWTASRAAVQGTLIVTLMEAD